MADTPILMALPPPAPALPYPQSIVAENALLPANTPRFGSSHHGSSHINDGPITQTPSIVTPAAIAMDSASTPVLRLPVPHELQDISEATCAPQPGTNCEWTTAIVETLLHAKEIVHVKRFTSTSNNKAKSRRWNLVTLDVNVAHKKKLTVEQVNKKYERLKAKWRDNSPNGAQTTATGNEEVDTSKVPNDAEMAILTTYFAKKHGRGADLGQGSQ
ncbi:hypothetical protein DFJ73DRAFT_766158 [Zopfochytrium polystomum]|nr:hypothetical protein DFJ73DRAFT_766158 [Zopfochytrium polystomum]